jgi:hypothetical protein
MSVRQLAEHFDRSSNAIRSRLIHLDDGVEEDGNHDWHLKEDFGDLWAC